MKAYGPAVIEALGGRTRGDGKGELKGLHTKVSNARWEEGCTVIAVQKARWSGGEMQK